MKLVKQICPIILLILFSGALPRTSLAEDAAPPTPAQREWLAKLAVQWAKARGNTEAQRQLVDQAIQIGPLAVEQLGRKIQPQYTRAMNDYGKAFEFQAKKLKTAPVADVLASNPRLPAMREEVVALGESMQQLTSAVGKSTISDFESYLGEQEDALLRRYRLGPVWSQLDPQEIAAIEATNEQRRQQSLPALTVDLLLVQTARDHSRDMVTLDFFAHESPVEGKTTFSDRASRFGAVAHGENIYYGSPSGAAAVTGWMNSPPHRANILKEDYQRIGIGRHNSHWTQLFGM